MADSLPPELHRVDSDASVYHDARDNFEWDGRMVASNDGEEGHVQGDAGTKGPAVSQSQPGPRRARRQSSSAVWRRVRNLLDVEAFSSHPFLSSLRSRLGVDGRVEMDIPSETEADSIMRTVVRRMSTLHLAADREPDNESPLSRTPTILEVGTRVPLLSIVIMIVGTRGDVQPFIAMAQRLQQYGHRVRLATHACFRDFVTSNGIEFFPLGGDPMKLAAYVVKNGGAMPASVGEAMDKLDMMREIIVSTYGACTAADPADPDARPFTADAIISNPPTYGHIHCAEALDIPLHMFFTMPWTPTREFPHPMSKLSNALDPGWQNFVSYIAMDWLLWAGMEPVINQFRQEVLYLPPISLMGHGGHGILNTNKVPFAYTWSPTLVPKPNDWGRNVDVVGFFFLADQSSPTGQGSPPEYAPDPDLAAFLEAGEPPLFFGFGSCKMEEDVALRLTRAIVGAVEETGRRAILQEGWGKLGHGVPLPDTILRIGNCPHTWLLPRMAAVCHHGGAGTTAAGLIAGKPTMIVPFTGDQPFWGQAVFRQGLGPPPCAVGDVTKQIVVDAINNYLFDEVVRDNVLRASRLLAEEDGVGAAVQVFHGHLPALYVCRR